MIDKLSEEVHFKSRNLQSWKRNTDFWLHSKLRQVEDTKDFLHSKLSFIDTNKKITIVDMGFGDGWIVRLLDELGANYEYYGLDFNPLFVEKLQNEYEGRKNLHFIECDFEESLPADLVGKADIVFNCFNFFELENISAAFENAALMLKKEAKLIILTIETAYLIRALSKDDEEYKKNLDRYEEIKSEHSIPFAFQKIDMDDHEEDEYEYASVLYSIKDYWDEGVKNKLTLTDYDEVVKTSKFIPKVYQYYNFKK